MNILPDQVLVGFEVATMCETGNPYGILHDHAVGIAGEEICWVSPNGELPELESSTKVVQGHGRLLTPGLIDCHTHLVYGGNRADEWEARLRGESYEAIAKAGGGILSTVRNTRLASEDELLNSAKSRLANLVAEGVTTVEIKSGYGLDLESELKMLKVAWRLGDETNIRVQGTLLGAHAVPPEFKGRTEDYLDLVCHEMIPAATGLCSAVDAFCETIAFDVEQTKRVLEVGKNHGLDVKVHAEQLSNLGMAAEAARMGALSADHLEYLSDGDCRVLAENDTVATLLPGAFYCLKEKKVPPIEALRKNGVKIAIATDSNPGSSPVVSLLIAGNLACNLFGLTPEEVLAGITRNAAAALGIQDQVGTISAGKKADLALWDVNSPAELLYQIGGTHCIGSLRNGRWLVEPCNE